MISLILKLLKSARSIDPPVVLIVLCWIALFPVLWVYARLFPRLPSRVLFWTNQGFQKPSSRVRSYFFCREFQRLSGDGRVLAFWDDIAGYHGIDDYRVSLTRRTIWTFRAMITATHSRSGVIVAQRPLYEFMALGYLKLMYPFGLSIWIDIDDWIFDTSLDESESSVRFRDLLPINVLFADGCIVASVPLEQEARKYFEQVEIIPTFPDASMFRPSDRAGPAIKGRHIVFSWAGTFWMEHVLEDILFLVKALDLLNDERVVLEVAGGGDYLDPVRREVSGIPKSLNVSFPGWIDPKQVPEYMAGIDVGLHCLSRHNDFTVSKSPTKLFEYMASAKPTVCTDYGEPRRFIEHGVTGFLAEGTEDFAKYCSILVNDPELRDAMGQRARKRIEEEYNISEGVKSLREILFRN